MKSIRLPPRCSRRQLVRGAGVAGLGLLAACGLPFTQPRQTGKVSRIGILTSSANSPDSSPNFEAFRQGLRELGYVEDHNIIIQRRHADGQAARLPELVAELIQLAVDLIVVGGTLAGRAAKDATDTIPIVMALANEPVRQGFVASLARPGGNITGLSMINVQLTGKQLELLKDT